MKTNYFHKLSVLIALILIIGAVVFQMVVAAHGSL